ncbi:MAG: hypothetical protein ACOH2B_00280 [Burkholderiaceae bacterium]
MQRRKLAKAGAVNLKSFSSALTTLPRSDQAAGLTPKVQFECCKTEGIAVDRMIKNNYANTAQLKELMTAPPMTAEQHAKVMRKRIAHRRMIEDAKESHLQNGADWEFSG